MYCPAELAGEYFHGLKSPAYIQNSISSHDLSDHCYICKPTVSLLYLGITGNYGKEDLTEMVLVESHNIGKHWLLSVCISVTRKL